MDSEELESRMSRISTQWTLVFQAHGGVADAPESAQRRLMQRYCGAAYRYLLGAVRNPDIADDLCQEFALRFLRGDFRRADPGRGRFRDYLKTSLRHLVTDYFRVRQQQLNLPENAPEPAAPMLDSEEDFLAGWRAELLERTWKALAEVNASYHAVLLARTREPEASSAELADRLSTTLGKTVTGDWVRKTVQRGQAKFAELLIAEAATSLESAAAEVVRQELGALDLVRYCRSVLDQRAKKTPGGD